MQIPPAEAAEFADAHPGGVQQSKNRPVAGILLQAEDMMQFRFRQNALGQPVAEGGEPQGATDIERQIPNAVTKGEQRLDG